MYLPLQQKENRELNERLSAVEKSQSMEREKQSKEIESLRKSEKEARAKVGTLPSLLEQLSFLQHELENTCREKENLEEQTNIYKAQIQQVGLFHGHLSVSNSTCINNSLNTWNINKFDLLNSLDRDTYVHLMRFSLIS